MVWPPEDMGYVQTHFWFSQELLVSSWVEVTGAATCFQATGGVLTRNELAPTARGLVADSTPHPRFCSRLWLAELP